MGDKLTQLQDCYDQLLDRMYATLTHVSAFHTYSNIASQSDENPFGPIAIERRRRAREEELARLKKDADSRRKQIRQQAQIDRQALTDAAVERLLAQKDEEDMAAFDREVEAKLQNDGGGLVPESEDVFKRNLSVFSGDLMLKYAQIDVLIESMPALDMSVGQQEDEIRELEGKIREKEREKLGVLEEREQVRRDLEEAILKVRRS